MLKNLKFRDLQVADCEIISEAFQKQGWHKPLSLYKEYLVFQKNGTRDIILAEWDGVFAGYLTINWNSDNKDFQEQDIPEIVDFNVLIPYQRLGIGTSLMDEAENRIKKVSAFAGIGFGVYQDYGAAQVLYIRRGYIPDGKGIMKDLIPLKYGDKVTVDDSLALYLTKKLI